MAQKKIKNLGFQFLRDIQDFKLEPQEPCLESNYRDAVHYAQSMFLNLQCKLSHQYNYLHIVISNKNDTNSTKSVRQDIAPLFVFQNQSHLFHQTNFIVLEQDMTSLIIKDNLQLASLLGEKAKIVRWTKKQLKYGLEKLYQEFRSKAESVDYQGQISDNPTSILITLEQFGNNVSEEEFQNLSDGLTTLIREYLNGNDLLCIITYGKEVKMHPSFGSEPLLDLGEVLIPFTEELERVTITEEYPIVQAQKKFEHLQFLYRDPELDKQRLQQRIWNKLRAFIMVFQAIAFFVSGTFVFFIEVDKDEKACYVKDDILNPLTQEEYLADQENAVDVYFRFHLAFYFIFVTTLVDLIRINLENLLIQYKKQLIVKIIKYFTIVSVTLSFASGIYATIVRFQFSGRVCSGDYAEGSENFRINDYLFFRGKFLFVLVILFWAGSVLGVVILSFFLKNLYNDYVREKELKDLDLDEYLIDKEFGLETSR